MKFNKLGGFVIVFAALAVSGCKTYNAVIHNGPGKEIPVAWDVDEPVTSNVFNSQTVSLKKACEKKGWETAMVYHQWPVGWKVAVKCKG